VYHFLCDLQFQDVQANPAWNWGILRKAAFLPRVRYGKVILARASWRLEPSETKPLKTLQGEQLLSHVGSLRERKRLPRWVVAAEGDNQLPLDLENSLCLQVLQSLLKGDEPLLLEECLAASDGCWVEGPEGRFTHEFILPLRCLSKAPVPAQVDSEAPALPRRLHPGSEWLYTKLYCGAKTADKILTAVIAPLTERLLAEGTIDKWFFIRYDDPHSHLRVRFHGQGNFQNRVLEALHRDLTPFFAANLVWKFQTDTYVRELERYGGENIVDSESLFFHDSVAVVRLLPLLSGDAGDEIRWRLALRGIDGLLNDFGLDLPAKRALLFGLQAHFKEEFRANTAKGKKSLGDKLRKERGAVATALQASYAPDQPLATAFDVLAQRSEDWREVVQSIKAKSLSVPRESLLGSYVHMFCNRIFRSRQRLQEMVAYDFLYHHYQAAAARSSNSMNIEKAFDPQILE
jgi:thiopeptide-type bacteriocin biosynthesis protein